MRSEGGVSEKRGHGVVVSCGGGHGVVFSGVGSCEFEGAHVYCFGCSIQ